MNKRFVSWELAKAAIPDDDHCSGNKTTETRDHCIECSVV